MSNLKGDVRTVFEVVETLKNISDGVRTTSLIDATKSARIQPLCVVSRDCGTYEYLSDILQTTLNLFTGYYLQAVSLAATVNGVKVMKVLDRFNPDREYSSPAFESYRDMRVLNDNSYKFTLPTRYNIAQESDLIDDAKKMNDDFKKGAKDYGAHLGNDGTTNASSKDNLSAVTEVNNLGVGKLLNVSVHIDKITHQIPVHVSLSTTLMATPAIEHLLTLKKEDTSLTERFHSWRAGRISFIRDLVMCQDMIDEHKKNLMFDDSGIYSEIIRRVNNNKKFGALSLNFSMATASNIFIISDEVAKAVEQRLGGRLSNPRIREAAFENTYAMFIVVIDRDRERVTFYSRGIPTATDCSIKDIRNGNKSKGPDISDVLKAFQVGNAPSF